MRIRIVVFLIAVFSKWGFAFAIELPSDEQLLSQLKSKLKGKGDYFDKVVHRKGNKVAEVEGWLSLEAELGYADRIAKDVSRWNTWVTPNINKAPEGGSYYMKLNELSPVAGKENSMQVKYSVNFTFLKRDFVRTFTMQTTSTNKSLTLCGESNASDNSLVVKVSACMKTFPAEKEPGRLWVYIRGAAQFYSWFLYEAFPEKLVMREIADRIPVIAENYVKEEDRLRNLETNKN